MLVAERTPAKKRIFSGIFRKYRAIYILMVPGLLYYIVYKYIPIYGIVIAFKKISPFSGPKEIFFGGEWVGLAYFQKFVSSYYFWNVLRNTLLLSIFRLACAVPLTLTLAILLNEVRNTTFKRIAQTISYLPHFISMVVTASLVYAVLSVDRGILNVAIRALGGEAKFFLADPRLFRGIIVTTAMWKGVGWGSIVYLAAISSIDQELYDAATIDGAGKLRQVFAITLPSITPIIVILLILRIGHILDAGFELVLNLYSPSVYETGDIIDTFVYREGLLNVQYSYAAAVGVFKSAIALILVITTDRVAKRLGQSGIW